MSAGEVLILGAVLYSLAELMSAGGARTSTADRRATIAVGVLGVVLILAGFAAVMVEVLR